MLFNCTEAAVIKATGECRCTNCSFDAISFKIIKSIASYLIKPLNFVYQQCLFRGLFSSAWKHEVVVLIFKGHGSRSEVGSNRLISFCPCLGKILGKIVHEQLSTYLSTNHHLQNSQHGFSQGKSTLTNLLIYQSINIIINRMISLFLILKTRLKRFCMI